MKIAITALLPLAILLSLGNSVLAAEQPAAATLAGILVDMNHFPSEGEKATLTAMAADESVDEDLRIIAGAMAGIEHQAKDESKAALESIAGDEESSTQAKTLAGAVLRFNHKVSGDDQAALKALAG